MSLVPDQAAFREFARTSDIVPVCLDLMADLETPVSVYELLGVHHPDPSLAAPAGDGTPG